MRDPARSRVRFRRHRRALAGPALLLATLVLVPAVLVVGLFAAAPAKGGSSSDHRGGGGLSVAIEWSIACLDPCVAPPHTLDFTAVVSGGASSFLVAWEFGDGSAPALGPSVEHTFPACGIYAISVVVTNGAATASNSMTVSSCPMV